MSMMYSMFNIGCVVGIGFTPLILEQLGWQLTFQFLGSIGLAVGFFGLMVVRQRGIEKENSCSNRLVMHVQKQNDFNDDVSWMSRVCSKLQQYKLTQLLTLCWAHAVIGFGFFVFQNWIPMYVRFLGFSLSGSGLVSMLPWVGAAITSFFAGKLVDLIISENQVSRWKVRRMAQLVATLGPASCLACLTILGDKVNVGGMFVLISILTIMISCTSFSFSGFHSYVQDVAPQEAGFVLSLTNSCGTLAGMVGNLVTGFIVEKTNSYIPIFQLCMVMYLSSALLWSIAMKGKPLRNDHRDNRLLY
eukprot:TRINITY_DN7391_c0_g2_i2.p2 TRINITY_DN7391_c0_g2~~TRINITY_DN7391_c0_g2_i2.p2  ORF type:complete len:336 (+),score=27.42 TRINITY_DN7391_c0_g2_i2:101-1009(+)